jgi:hypothetical protein
MRNRLRLLVTGDGGLLGIELSGALAERAHSLAMAKNRYAVLRGLPAGGNVIRAIGPAVGAGDILVLAAKFMILSRSPR